MTEKCARRENTGPEIAAHYNALGLVLSVNAQETAVTRKRLFIFSSFYSRQHLTHLTTAIKSGPAFKQ